MFRGYSPRRGVDPGHLRGRLKDVFSTRAARLGTLHQLTKLAPVLLPLEKPEIHTTCRDCGRPLRVLG